MKKLIYIINSILFFLVFSNCYTQNFSLRYSVHYIQTNIDYSNKYRFIRDYNSYNIGVEFVNKINKSIPVYFSTGINHNIIKEKYYSVATLQIPLFINAEFGKKVKGDIGIGIAYSYGKVLNDKTATDLYKSLIIKHTANIIYRAGIKFNIKNGHYLGVSIKMNQSLSPIYKMQRGSIQGSYRGELIFKSYSTGFGIFYEMPLNFIKGKHNNEDN